MKELYLVAYTYEAHVITSERGLKSISFGESFKNLHSVKEIIQEIEKQTGDRAVKLIAVTELHKIIDYVGEETETNSPDFVSTSY